MSAVANVQKCIRLLCSLYADIGVAKPSAETLRMAKFNKPEASELMWDLLVQTVATLTCIEEHRTVPKFCPQSCWKLIGCKSVLLYCFRLGYRRPDFFVTETPLVSSRELLLAFGYLLCSSRFIDRLLDVYVHILSERSVAGKVQCPNLQTSKPLFDKPSDTTFRHLAMLRGKIKNLNKLLFSSEQALIKAVSDIHKYTFNNYKAVSCIDGFQQPHLTLHEVNLLFHPKLLSERIKKLECAITALSNVIDWRKNYNAIFWKWLESVIDLQFKDGPCGETDRVTKESVLLRTKQVWSVTCKHYNQAHPYIKQSDTTFNTDEPIVGSTNIDLYHTSDVIYTSSDTFKSRGTPCVSLRSKIIEMEEVKTRLVGDLQCLRETVKKELDLVCKRLPSNCTVHKPISK